MALDWIPIFPDVVPHRRSLILGDNEQPFTFAVIPPVQAPGFLSFLPIFPDLVPHHASRAARTETIKPPPYFLAAITPVSWIPIYPDRVPHRRLTAGSHPSYQSTTYGDLMVIAQQEAWKATFPDRVPHRRPPAGFGGFSVYPIQPSVAAAVPGICVDLVNDLLVSSTFLSEALHSSTLITEGETSSTFLTEAIC